MEFIVNSQEFFKQLQTVSSVLTSSNTVPIINCFHFHLDESKLTVKATDLDTTFVTSFAVETGAVVGRDEIAIQGKKLLEILKSMGDTSLKLEVDDATLSVRITSGSGDYHLAGADPETFPSLNLPENTVSTTMKASALVSAITKTIFATGSDELRPQMSGIYCELTPTQTTFVSTDSHKMVRLIRKDIVCDESVNFILPKKPITIVKSAMSAVTEDLDVRMEFNNTNVAFHFGESSIYCQLIEGQYPNYNAAIPKENPNKMTIDRSSLLNALHRVGIFANPSTHQIRLGVGGLELDISTEDIESANAANEKLPYSYDGESFDIGFNEKFLSEMISNIDTEHILITLSNPTRAGIIFPVEEKDDNPEDLLMLVMPVMLNR